MDWINVVDWLVIRRHFSLSATQGWRWKVGTEDYLLFQLFSLPKERYFSNIAFVIEICRYAAGMDGKCGSVDA